MRYDVRVTSVPYRDVRVLFRIDLVDGATADTTLPMALTHPKITRVIAYSYCSFCSVSLMLLWSLLMLLFLDHWSLIILVFDFLIAVCLEQDPQGQADFAEAFH